MQGHKVALPRIYTLYVLTADNLRVILEGVCQIIAKRERLIVTQYNIHSQ